MLAHGNRKGDKRLSLPRLGLSEFEFLIFKYLTSFSILSILEGLKLKNW